MKLIYIVEEQDLIPPESQGSEQKEVVTSVPMSRGESSKVIVNSVIGTGSIAKSVMLGVPFMVLPFPLVAAAIIARPLLASAYANDKNKSDSAEWKAIEKAEIQTFLRRNALTEDQAEKNGYIFPPGHPEIGRAYVLHPLSCLKGAGKSNIYIPQEKYDEILLEEREAELIKILVTLGAVKITITEKNSATDKSLLNANLTGKSLLAGAEVDLSTSQQQVLNDHSCREFQLIGSDWKKGDRIDKNEFAWIQFEPSWGALIVARELGGCTKASIELRENTTFASEKTIASKISGKVLAAEVSASVKAESENEKSYFFVVEFTNLSK